MRKIICCVINRQHKITGQRRYFARACTHPRNGSQGKWFASDTDGMLREEGAEPLLVGYARALLRHLLLDLNEIIGVRTQHIGEIHIINRCVRGHV